MRWFMVLSAMLALAAFGAVAGDEAPWFDMENCEMCSPLMNDPELLPNVAWEHYNIANGIVTVTTVMDEHRASWDKVVAKMDAVAKKMEAGEPVKLCGMCMAMDDLYKRGAKWEQVETRYGSVSLMTSDKPEMVAEIQAWAKRTNDEMAKMEAAEDVDSPNE
ncbi:MAG: hypothetical protein OEW00_08405 [candidate division Zixibacteria bacterium]|nr:hypothetical protein [candidate division Zixibacteria bacterium]